jgi:Family of unknown function (DUF6364)
MKNITLSVEETTLKKAREAARQRGLSLNALIRDYLEELAGSRNRHRSAQALRKLWADGGGSSGGKKIRREDAYEGRA